MHDQKLAYRIFFQARRPKILKSRFQLRSSSRSPSLHLRTLAFPPCWRWCGPTTCRYCRKTHLPSFQPKGLINRIYYRIQTHLFPSFSGKSAGTSQLGLSASAQFSVCALGEFLHYLHPNVCFRIHTQSIDRGQIFNETFVFGIISLMGAMLPLPRVIYAMAGDGIIFRFLGKIHPRFQTPLLGTVLAGLLTGTKILKRRNHENKIISYSILQCIF